jgi:prolyl 4-hydroxylase
LKNKIWDAAKTTLQEWTGEELMQCSLYGIRVYTEGAMLAPHVDRLPLVSSAIVNVAQDTDEPWPIEVYSHDGKAYNVTMEPGEMVLYESHSVLHGRPFPMKGRFYANVFIHFEPIGHSLRHDAKINAGEVGGDVNKKYRESVAKKQGGHENDHDGLPSYILKGTNEEMKWKKSHPTGSKSDSGQTAAHDAAKRGDVENILSIIDKKKHLVHRKDGNGWAPIHEATRNGHIEIVKTLIEKGGANVNELTGLNNDGESILHMAFQTHGADHPLVDYLNSIGALMIGPDL